MSTRLKSDCSILSKVLTKMEITTLACQVLVILFILVVHGKDDDFNIDVKQMNAEVYHEQSAKNNEFNYGYQVEKENSQFQHKAKGPDDVTYGCYGYIDPNNEKHLVYYVADRLGYRLVQPNQPTKIFSERVASSINKLNKDLKDKTLDGKVIAWNDLYLPDSCRRLDEILTITTPSPRSGEIDSLEKGIGNPPTLLNQTKNMQGTTKTPYVATTSVRTNSRAPTQNTHGPFSTESVKVTNDFLSTTTTRTTQDNYDSQETIIVESTTDNHFNQNAKRPNSTTPKISTGNIGDLQNKKMVTPLESTTASTSTQSLGGYTYPIPKNHLPNCQQQNPPVLGQYNGYVYPINGECSTSEYNVHQLMIQMEALNKQVLELSANLRALQQTNLTSSTLEDSDCRKWLTRQQFPLLIYVPILLPYIGNEFDGKSHKSFINPASYAFQKMCEDCVNK